MKDKKVSVIGGGKVAYFKIKSLLKEGATITVISPKLDHNITLLVEKKEVQWLQKEYERCDVVSSFLIIAATNDELVNERVEEEADPNQLVNVVTNPERGNCHFPATVRRGKLILAVSSGGASPKLTKQIRDHLAAIYDESYEDYVDFLYDCRLKIKQYDDKEKRRQLLEEVLEDMYRIDENKRNQFYENLTEYVKRKGDC